VQDYVLTVDAYEALSDTFLVSNTVITDCEIKVVDFIKVVEGFVDGNKVRVHRGWVRPLFSELSAKSRMPSYDFTEQRQLWHPEHRIMTVEDTEDYHSGKIIKKNTIMEDWIDNEDGTIEMTLDGIIVSRINKDSVIKIMP
jgi:hypothetical protein